MGNPVCELEDYQEKVFELIPSLEVLDGFNQEGDEVDSFDYDDEIGGEEGEEEIEEQLMQHLTEEQKAEMAKKGMSAADYLASQQADGFADEDDEDYGEEGEEEDDYGDEGEENGGAPQVGEKRQRDEDDEDGEEDDSDDVGDEGPQKKQKEE